MTRYFKTPEQAQMAIDRLSPQERTGREYPKQGERGWFIARRRKRAQPTEQKQQRMPDWRSW